MRKIMWILFDCEESWGTKYENHISTFKSSSVYVFHVVHSSIPSHFLHYQNLTTAFAMKN